MNLPMEQSFGGQAAPRLPAAGMDALMRAEIDIQISTAHAYPRSISRVTGNVTSLVTMSKQSAEECIFSLPRGGKPIVGPSIRLAEILFSQWGNCTGGSRTVEVNRKEGYVEAEGVFHDLETNAKTVRRTRRRITDKSGRVFSDDMIIVTANAAGSIAFRNAVLAGVPRAVWGEAYAQAERTIRGDIKTLPERRDAAMKAMASFGLSAEDVCNILGIGGVKDIDLDQLVVIGGLHNALKEGEVSGEALLASAEGGDNKADRSAKEILKAVSGGKKPTERKKVDRTPPKPAQKPKQEPEVVDEAPKEQAAAARTEVDAQGDTIDTETGEVLQEGAKDAGEVKAPGDAAGDTVKYEQLANSIRQDLENTEDPDSVQTFYADPLAEMRVKAPMIHAALMDDFAKFV